jgi:hypothetical protein
VSSKYRTLKEDNLTYSIHNDSIYAHNGAGLLYGDGEYSLVGLKESLKGEFTVEEKSAIILGEITEILGEITASPKTKIIEEVSFKRIGTNKDIHKVYLNNLIKEVSFKRIKSSK